MPAITNYQPSLALTTSVVTSGVLENSSTNGWGAALGMVRFFAGNFGMDGQPLANGQLLQVAQNSQLASLYGTLFGGNGTTTFGVPDLGGRTLIGSGYGPGLPQVVSSHVYGADAVAIRQENLTFHAGGARAFIANQQPSLGLHYMIQVQGIFPPRADDTTGVAQNGGNAFLGTIAVFASDSLPQNGWIECKGQILSIQQNYALFVILGTTYGGDGQTTFALPNLSGRDIIGWGQGPDGYQFVLGESWGYDAQVSDANMPANMGGIGQSLRNYQPYLVMNYIIALDGPVPTATGSGDEDNENSFAGEIIAFAGNYAPTGFALCRGQTLTIAGHEHLYAAIGTTYGGDGVTTFALPNLQGRSVIGTDATHLLGQNYGASTFTLTSADMPALDIHDTDDGHTLYGGDGGDHIYGNGGNDTLTGNDGNDYLEGGSGGDTLQGGRGDDTYAIDSLDTLVETPGEGTDTVLAGFSYTLGDNVENLDLSSASGNIDGTGNGGNNSVYGNGDSNILRGLGGNDYLYGGSGGTDSLYGGAGDDTYYVLTAGQMASEQTVAGVDDGGTDRVISYISYVLPAYIEKLSLAANGQPLNGTGNGSNNVIEGNTAANVLRGLGGNDSLDGKAGIDRMFGGAGNDTYYVDTAGELVSEQTVAGVDDGGTDTVNSSVSFTLGLFLENLTLTGTGAVNGTGNTGNNLLYGNDGVNVLRGLGGNDYLWGQGGADRLYGGAGNDTYYVEAGDVVSEQTVAGVDDGGTDIVISTVNYTLGDFVENLLLDYGSSATNGTGNGLGNEITGNAAVNVLRGLGGNDVLNGLGGADRMFGGAGDDTYFVDTVGEIVSEQTVAGVDDGGIDTVSSSITWALTAYLENLTLTTAGTTGTGNGLANVLTALGGIYTLAGKAGDDTYVVDNAGTTIVEGIGQGIDTVVSHYAYTLGANVENLTMTNTVDQYYVHGTGNELNNVITGGFNGVNALDGGAGADTLIGGKWGDFYTVDNVGDVIVETYDDGGLNPDTVLSFVTYTLSANLERLIAQGLDAINLTGNNLDNPIHGNANVNVLKGMDGNDALYAYEMDDTLYGGQGGDTLDGGTGDDKMYGGSGNDTYIVDSAADTTSEQAVAGIDDGGTDTVRSSVSWTLGDFLENLSLTGASVIDGTGNNLNNVIDGNGAVNILRGLGGNDTLAGHSGNDSLTGGNGSDRFVFDSAGTANGLDRITDFVSGIDQLVFSASDFGWTAGHVLTAGEITFGTVGAGTPLFYNTTSHALYVDTNGAAAGGLVAVAIFTNNAAPVIGDFAFV